jgi:hypothetical protein
LSHNTSSVVRPFNSAGFIAAFTELDASCDHTRPEQRTKSDVIRILLMVLKIGFNLLDYNTTSAVV